jgi:hypothetical protein
VPAVPQLLVSETQDTVAAVLRVVLGVWVVRRRLAAAQAAPVVVEAQAVEQAAYMVQVVTPEALAAVRAMQVSPLQQPMAPNTTHLLVRAVAPMHRVVQVEVREF